MFTHDASPFRRAMERRSAALLLYLRQLPVWLVGGCALALLLVGLIVPSPAAAAPLFLLAVLLAWLAYLSWVRLAPPARLIRIVVVAGLVAAGVHKLSG
jgi:hypothetical protein